MILFAFFLRLCPAWRRLLLFVNLLWIRPLSFLKVITYLHHGHLISMLSLIHLLRFFTVFINMPLGKVIPYLTRLLWLFRLILFRIYDWLLSYTSYCGKLLSYIINFLLLWLLFVVRSWPFVCQWSRRGLTRILFTVITLRRLEWFWNRVRLFIIACLLVAVVGSISWSLYGLLSYIYRLHLTVLWVM